MELEIRKIGEIVGVVGVVLGFVAIWTNYLDKKYTDGVTPFKYADDGTLMVALIIVLVLAACCLLASLLDVADLDLVAATAGAVAFGMFLFVPSWVFAFKYFDKLGTGGWLGICAGLIPLGAGFAHLARKRSDKKAPGVDLAIVAAVVVIVLVVIGIWFELANDDKTTFWKASASGHALGLLMLLLAIVSALLIVAAVSARSGLLADLALIVSGITAGLAMYFEIWAAFKHLGDLGSGAWLELIGGLLLLLGLIGTRVLKLPEIVKLPEVEVKKKPA